VFRSALGIGIRQILPAAQAASPSDTAQTNVALTEGLLESVRKAMPPHPWPKAIHRAVASQLGQSPSLVWRAITELIRRGEFLMQIDGKLFTEAKPPKNT
jgi:hypothetical protein